MPTWTAYAAALRDRLAQPGFRILELPDVAHNVLLERAISARRPFGGHDSGYRDTLIWFGVQSLAVDDEVVLISENREDFGFKGTPEALHSHLVEDLKAGGLDDRVTLLHSTERFIELYVPPDAEALYALEHKLAQTDSRLRNALLGVIAKSLEGQSLDDQEGLRLPCADALEGSTIQAVEELSEVTVSSARRLDDHRAVLEARATAVVSADYFIYKADLYASGEEEQVDILDSDWNRHYVWAQAELGAHLELAATVDVDADEVLDLDIAELSF